MNIKKNLWLLFIFVCMLPSVAWAQEEMSAEEELDSAYTDINEHMELFQEELIQLNALCRFRMDIDMEMPLNEPLLDVVSERLKSLSLALNSFSTRWDTYSAAQQVYIADNDSLLNRAALIQQMRQAVTDTLALRQQQRDQLVAFSTAEQFIWSQDKNYRQLYKKAVQYSATSMLAAKLEKVKAEEQALTADVNKYYSQAKEAATAFPGLQLRMEAMENKVFELQTVSAKIQEMAYKPFIQRIKDYLLGLACVAILLMGLNLLKSKLAMVKQARDQAKKLKSLANGQHNYPTI
jgi:hypothetical protein